MLSWLHTCEPTTLAVATGHRFSADTAFGGEQAAAQELHLAHQQAVLGAGTSGSTPHTGGSLFMSPAELRALAEASAAVAPGSRGAGADDEGGEDPLLALLQRLERQQQEAESEAAQRLAEIESDIAAAVASRESDSAAGCGDDNGSEGAAGEDDVGLGARASELGSLGGEQSFLHNLAQQLHLQAEGSSGSSSVVTAVSTQAEETEEDTAFG